MIPRPALPTYTPPPTPTALAKTVDTYRAPCEVCGAECDWTLRDPAGMCPCVPAAPAAADVTDGEEAAS